MSLFSVVAHLMFPCLDFFAVFSVVMLMYQGFINVFFFLDERINRVPKKKTLINPCYACTEFALLDSFFLKIKELIYQTCSQEFSILFLGINYGPVKLIQGRQSLHKSLQFRQLYVLVRNQNSTTKLLVDIPKKKLIESMLDFRC